MDSRINKSRIGSSQEQHHSGPTESHSPDTAADPEEAPQQKEMWSIFSTYPETLSQNIGRQLKILRLQSATIALHDEVEEDVKARITEEEEKEERAQRDILVIDNEEERLIRDEVQARNKKISKVERRKSQIPKSRKVKSVVARPDIRNWLNSRTDCKSNKDESEAASEKEEDSDDLIDIIK